MYQILRDFAGPVATIIAAATAVFVTWCLGLRQAKIAEAQTDLNREKLRHDLYNRRFEIFSSIFDYYDAVFFSNKTPTLEQQAARQRFFRAYQESVFLFTKASGIPDLLKMLNEKGHEVISYKEHSDIYKGDPDRIIEESKKFTDNLNAFESGLAQLRAAMHPYLDFSKN